MNHLQRLTRRAGLLRDAQPQRGDRPGARDPHDPLRPPGLHARRASPRSPGTREISGVRPHALLRRLLGLGLPRGRRASARCARCEPFGSDAVSAARCTRAACATAGSSATDGDGRSRDEFRHRLFMAYLDLDELPGRARRPACSGPRAGRRSPGSAAPTTSATRPRRCADAVRELVPSAPARARTGRSACSRTCAASATASTRSASTTASTPATASRSQAVVADVTNTPWGERHAYVLDVDERRPRQHAARARRLSEAAARLAADGHGPRPTSWRLTEPGERLSVHIESSRNDGGDARGLRRDAVAATAASGRAGTLARLLAPLPAPDGARSSRASTPTRCACACAAPATTRTRAQGRTAA